MALLHTTRPTADRHIHRRPAAAAALDPRLKAPRYPDNLRRLIPVLRAHGVHTATATFSGKGDSSWVDDVAIEPAVDADVTVRSDRVARVRIGDDATAERAIEEVSPEEAFEEIAGEIVAMRRFHWDRGAPRYGTVSIDIRSGNTTVAVHWLRAN